MSEAEVAQSAALPHRAERLPGGDRVEIVHPAHTRVAAQYTTVESTVYTSHHTPVLVDQQDGGVGRVSDHLVHFVLRILKHGQRLARLHAVGQVGLDGAVEPGPERDPAVAVALVSLGDHLLDEGPRVCRHGSELSRKQ